jgi:hypothetical protein
MRLLCLFVVLLLQLSKGQDVAPPRVKVSLDEPALTRWNHVLATHNLNQSLHDSINLVLENKLFAKVILL